MRIPTWQLGALAIALGLFHGTSCVKRKKNIQEIPGNGFKTGAQRDDGTNGRDSFIDNSAFEEPKDNIAQPAPEKLEQVTKPEETKEAQTTPSAPASNTSVPVPGSTTNVPPIPTSPTTPTTPTNTKDKAPTQNPVPIDPGGKIPTTPGKGPVTPVVSRMPVRRVCSNWATNFHRFTLSTMNPDDLIIRLYPVQAPMTTPIDMNIDRRAAITDMINTGDFNPNMAGVPDGTYNMVFCNRRFGCKQPAFFTHYANLQRYQEWYRWELNAEYQRQRSYGMTHGFTREFAGQSRYFTMFRDNVIMETPGVFGGVPRLVVEQGRLSFPAEGIIVRNNGIAVVYSDKRSNTYPTIVPPQIPVVYRDARNARIPQPTGKAPGTWTPDGCDENYSPLIIDFPNTGVRLSPPLDGVTFDLDADGTKDKVSWPISAESAFLVLDINKNNEVDDGGELFGNSSKTPDGKPAANGFEALARYDDNGDKRIDAGDKIFKELRLWFDENMDGKADKGELVPLMERGIKEFDLNYENMYEEDEFGNQTRQRGTVTLKGGTLRMVFDIWLRKL